MSLLDENFDLNIKDLIINGLRQLLKGPNDNGGSSGCESYKEYMSKKANSLSRFVGFDRRRFKNRK